MSELAKTLISDGQGSSEQPARSLNRQAVLEEDEYTAALSQIIARDFFPSLVHLDATNNYLDALSSADPHLIHQSVRQLQDLATPARNAHYKPLQTPSQTPWAGEPSDTPLRTPFASEGRPSKRARYDSSLSLDEFQAKYTSEDNSSFTQILEDENVKRREKYSWAWNAQKRVEAQRDRMVEMRERMLIEPAPAIGVPGKFAIEAPTPAGLITQSEAQATEGQESASESRTEAEGESNDDSPDQSSKVLIVSEKPGVEGETVDVMAAKRDKRPAVVDGWKFKTRNALMFPPDADASPYASSITATGKGDPKVIKHGNTRLPEQEETVGGSALSEPPSPTRSRIIAAIAGTPYRPRSPTINDYSLLPTMPSPTAEQLGPAAVKELMTWGTLNATPRIISKSEDDDIPTPNTPFRINRPSSREVISMKLSNNAGKSLREKAAVMRGGSGVRSLVSRTPGLMAPPTSTPRRADAMGALTPAARRLLDRTTSGVAGSRRADAMGKTSGWEGKGAKAKEKEKDLNKVRWTPSPAPVARKLV
ncbi:hypothetical protein SCHPADRAFT_842573 [Schizopora paradoxa]|uniref:Nuclear protein DGCR14 n=1 Tax=Schizopora paradoxa TaxID=27342 RepID=A0A0H2S7K9_9AGAM|nr:hypothetical protein SCHPADRAFT_842573 [Schizopora paradoxa]